MTSTLSKSMLLNPRMNTSDTSAGATQQPRQRPKNGGNSVAMNDGTVTNKEYARHQAKLRSYAGTDELCQGLSLDRR